MMDGPSHEPLEGPVFPPEIFEAIISILAARPSTVALTEDQKSTLKSCSLVSRSFSALSRAHLFRLAEIGLDGDEVGRWDRLVGILEATPSMRRAVQQISISLDTFTWPEMSEADLQKRTDALLSLSDVRYIAVCYPNRRREGRGRTSTADKLELFCTRLIESHATKAALDTLVVKKMLDIPYTTLFVCPSLTTLSLDRCHPFPDLTEPIHTIQSLTWRKMDLPVTTLSYFPNLEVLRIIRADIKECSALAIARLPAPSFQIRTLTLEQCSRYLGGPGTFAASITALLKYFYGKGEETTVKPFDHLTTLSVVLSEYAEFSVVAPLLKDVAGTLQSFCFGVFPPIEVSVVNLVQQLQKSNWNISFKYQSMENLDLVSNVNMCTETLFPLVTSFYPSFTVDRLVQHPEFAANDDNEVRSDESEVVFLQSWDTFVSSLLFDTHSSLGSTEPRDVEIYLLVDDSPNIAKREQDVTDKMVDSIVKGSGIFAGTYWDDFDEARRHPSQCSHDRRRSTARIIFHVDEDFA